MNKILFITNRLPFPKTDGRKNILSQYCEQIKEIYPDCSIVNLSFVDEKKHLNEKPDFISKVIELDPPHFFEKIYNVVIHSFIRRKWPIQVAVYYSRSTHHRIKKIIEHEKPDFIFYDMVRLAEYIVQCESQTIMSYDDLLSLRYKRQLQWIKYTPSLLGSFAYKLPKVIRPLFNMKYFQSLLLKFESYLLVKYEVEVAKVFDKLIFTSPKEAKEFQLLTTHPVCMGIPMVFETKNRMDKRSIDKNKIVFVGKMDIPHNISAVLYFYNKIWPKVKMHSPNAKFYIIGKSPAPEISELARQKDIIVTGEMKNIFEAIQDAAVFVAPLLFGTGIKTKVIEAMSIGIPVVATTIGAEGIFYGENKGLFVTDDSEEFVEYILKLMNNVELNYEVTNNGYKLIDEYYSKTRSISRWDELLNNRCITHS